jgi:uncharacterized integral membrane protein (TIGR00697 family)
MTSPLRIIIGEDWQPRLLPYFAMALMGMMLITNVLNLKFIDIAGFSLLASYPTYIFTLILTDIMAEVYGYRRIKRLLYVGLGMLVFYGVVIHVIALWPPAEGYPNNQAFVTLFAAAPRLVLASVTAFFVVEVTNSFVMSRLKVRYRARYFYGRALASVALAQAIDCVTFFGIAYAGTMPASLLVRTMAAGWPLVVACEVVVLPLTRKLAVAVRDYEGVQYYDKAPPEPPPGA